MLPNVARKLIMGDRALKTEARPFLFARVGRNRSCVARCSLQYPLLFLEKIFCLALIIGESRDSGCSPGLDEKGK
jgi:hypothetical protein